MFKLKKLILFSLLFASAYFSPGQNKPFPQALTFPNCIKPNNVTQASMNTSVASYYTYWKGKYLKNNLASLPGGYYVKGDITGSADGYTPLGSSEGQGYGMIIAVLMAGNDANAQAIFDGLFKTARAYKSSVNSNLMGWVVADAASAQGHFDSATDGDLDIAYSLLLAHYQWGSAGAINYLAEAQKMINNGLKTSYVTNSNRLNLGDWASKSTTDTRPSDWMLSHFKAYKAATGDVTWDNVSSATYSLINSIQTNYSSTTGLMPDFATGNPVKPAAPNFLESDNDGDYYYNACRTPLRFVMDFAHYGETKAKTAVNNILTWAKTKTSNNPANFRAGYTLAGADVSGNNYASAVFVAPIVAAATCDVSHQAYLNSGWSTITGMKEGYFEDTYNLLCMLYISGNWWIPQTTLSNQSPTVSITSPANNATFTAPASVTINATAADADGTISKVDFYNGTTLLNSDNASPYSYTWASVAAGTYSLTAKAYDNSGAVTTSSTISITVNAVTNQSPTVSITSPTNNATFIAPASVTINATAADADGTISKVEFYNGTTLLNSDNASPYSYIWTNVAAGTYTITAKATDNSGNSTTSSVVTVTVTVPESPYGGTRASIPGTIEAENYDLGGQGVAFNDVTPTNEGGAYRTDAIDIETTTGGGFNVGYIQAGEWMKYMVNVTTAGKYKIEAYVASTTAGNSFTLDLDGTNLGTFNVPNTGDWQAWQVVTINNVDLTTGNKILRFNATTANFNFDKVVFSIMNNSAPSVSITSPVNNATFTAPASVTINATATDADGTISKIDFYNGTTLLNSDNTSPYSYSWTGVAAGTYAITAKATDNSGNVTTSSTINIVVNGTTSSNFKVIGYYPTWMNYPNGINNINLSRVTHVNIAFANPNASGVLVPSGGTNADVTTMVNACHAKGVKVFMSIGGAGASGSRYQSLITTNQATFITNIVNYATTYNLDGIDVDIEGNVLDGTILTASQYEGFITALGNALHAQNKLMSAALANWFAQYVTNTAASKFDWINIMSYDEYGPWSGPGQHSPYSKAVSDFQYWNTTKAVPASKLTIGVPFYGYGWGTYTPADNDEISYCDIVNTYPGAENKDQIGSGNDVIYYNGIPTIKQKAAYALQNTGGIMIWEIAEDCSDNKSLLLAIDQVVHPVTNQLPTVSITSPTNNATFTALASVTINATAADADGTISKVEFYNGTTLLGTDNATPYSFAWTGVASGSYTITAKAYDNSGAITTSNAVSITVNPPANQLPTISITSPANNASFTAPASVTISATAADADGTISKVEFYNGTTLLNSDNTSPYSYVWTGVAAGTYSLTAKAYDNTGAITTSSAVSITVNPPANQLPTISITSPANNASFTAPASVTISATAADADGSISKVEFYNGTTLLNSDNTSPYSYVWTGVAAGTYSLTAKAYDNTGAITTSSAVSITVNPPANQLPTISITSPANNASFTAPASVTISATAADADGSISKVEFYNGTTLLNSDNTSPYSYLWTGVAAGTYSLTAKAYDNTGATTTSTIVSITVKAGSTGTEDCSNIATWNSAAIYVVDNLVTYQGFKYRAKWWTQNENPAAKSGQWDVWQKIGECIPSTLAALVPKISMAPASNTSMPITDVLDLDIEGISSGSASQVSYILYKDSVQKSLITKNAPDFTAIWNASEIGDYLLQVVVRDQNGMLIYSDAKSVKVSVATGILNANHSQSIQVIPNPNNARFHLTIPTNEKLIGSSVEIIDMMGHKVYETKLQSLEEEIAPDNLMSGNYLLKVINGKQLFITKIIVY